MSGHFLPSSSQSGSMSGHSQSVHENTESSQSTVKQKQENTFTTDFSKSLLFYLNSEHCLQLLYMTEVNVYSSPSLIWTPLPPNNSVLIRHMSFGDREHYMHARYFAVKNLCPLWRGVVSRLCAKSWDQGTQILWIFKLLEREEYN